jgi:hypothetical protein
VFLHRFFFVSDQYNNCTNNATLFLMNHARPHVHLITFRRTFALYILLLVFFFFPLTMSFSNHILHTPRRLPRLHSVLLRCQATKIDKSSPAALIGKWVTLSSDSSKYGQITASKGGWFTISLKDSNSVRYC